jgi:tetratricopeptide (TPR) repeat protein
MTPTFLRLLTLSLVACCLAGAVPAAAADPQVAEAFAASYKLEAKKNFAEAAKPMEPLAGKGNDLAQLRLAWLAYLQGKYDASEQAYAVVIERKPTALEPRLGRMLPLMAAKRWDDAIAEGQAVLGQSAWDYNAHVRMLACEEALGHWDVVETHAMNLATVFPSDATALVYLARAKAQKGDKAAAREAYDRVLERVPAHAEALAQLKKLK